MIIRNYKQALGYIHRFIPKGSLRYPGETGLKRQLYLLENLGNPQNRYPVIHLAGTSGKGSTATFLSRFLAGHGFKVGLTVSPHIFDIRERIQINNKWISQKDFVSLLNKVIPSIEKAIKNGWGEPTYFEIMVTMFYLAFYLYKVDYAIIETGLGGLMDGTNVVTSENKIAVITRLGLDHTRILGDTIDKIAYQKAGIIHRKNMVVSLWQNKKARLVLEGAAEKNLSPIWYLKKGINYKNVRQKEDGLVYDFKFNDWILKDLVLTTIGLYQVENSALALGVFKKVSERDGFKIDENIVKKILLNFKFSGRADVFEVKDKNNKPVTIIYDGAHNPQKMAGFIDSLELSFPEQKFIFVVAFKQKKEAKKMLEKIIPMASKIILTSFVVDDQDMAAVSQTINNLTEILKKLKFDRYQIIQNPNRAVKNATNESKLVAVTGSLYLLCKIYPQMSGISTFGKE